MFSFKPFVAAVALGAALLLAPVSLDARTTAPHTTLLVKHKKPAKHRKTHRKHATRTASKTKSTHSKSLSTHAKPTHGVSTTGTRHHPV